MIEVTAAAATFGDKKSLTQALAEAMMRWEGTLAIPLFPDNTAAFVRDLDAGALSNAAGRGDHVRVGVLTPEGVPMTREPGI